MSLLQKCLRIFLQVVFTMPEFSYSNQDQNEFPSITVSHATCEDGTETRHIFVGGRRAECKTKHLGIRGIERGLFSVVF